MGGELLIMPLIPPLLCNSPPTALVKILHQGAQNRNLGDTMIPLEVLDPSSLKKIRQSKPRHKQEAEQEQFHYDSRLLVYKKYVVHDLIIIE